MPYVDIADKDTLDKMNNKIGVTSDSGGSSTSGTVMAKLNNIIGNVSANTSYTKEVSSVTVSMVNSGNFNIIGTSSEPGYKYVKVGSFYCNRAGDVNLLLSCQCFPSSETYSKFSPIGGNMRVIVSTTNTSTPDASILNTMVGESNSDNGFFLGTAKKMYNISMLNLSNRYYYIYFMCDWSRLYTGTAGVDFQISTLMCELTYTTNVKTNSIIKRIQYGTRDGGVVDIYPVVPEKCLVIINPLNSATHSGGDMSYATCDNAGAILMSNKLYIIASATNGDTSGVKLYGGNVTWQIIEFY